MRRFFVIAVVVVVIVAAAVLWVIARGPDLSEYEPLVEPRIATLADQPVVQVRAEGDPNVVGSDAFGLLYEAYYSLDGVPRGPGQPAPRARWPVGADVASEDWIGLYAMPVPADVEELPPLESESALSAELTTWSYGEVAEILHKGPYDEETPTIDRLKQFIADSGYEIVGLHEEEYLRGPGMFLPVSPDDYYTIIRYKVSKLD